jgi:hypothetical protein
VLDGVRGGVQSAVGLDSTRLPISLHTQQEEHITYFTFFHPLRPNSTTTWPPCIHIAYSELGAGQARLVESTTTNGEVKLNPLPNLVVTGQLGATPLPISSHFKSDSGVGNLAALIPEPSCGNTNEGVCTYTLTKPLVEVEVKYERFITETGLFDCTNPLSVYK